MSETASIKIEFKSAKDTQKAYDFLINCNSQYESYIHVSYTNSIVDSGTADSYDEYELFEEIAEKLGESGIRFSGYRTYCSESTGNEYNEMFKSDGEKFVVLDTHMCKYCGKVVSLKNGIHYSDDYGANEWYCKEEGKEFLVDSIDDRVLSGKIMLDKEKTKGKALEDLSIKKLISIMRDSKDKDDFSIEYEGN